MDQTNRDDGRGPTGLASAIALYGRPEEQELAIPVSRETLEYWRRLKDGRVAEVVLLVRRPNGHYLLHTKPFYPEGAYRLMTGGIHAGEDLIEAAMREAREETGLDVRPERFVGVLRERYVHGDESFDFTSYLIELAELGGVLGVLDEHEQISGYREVAAHVFLTVATDLESLSGRWRDWGAIRGPAHRLAAQVLLGGTGA
ncbi:MAG: NUDIX hydrolase [Anaerolineae bacterium]